MLSSDALVALPELPRELVKFSTSSAMLLEIAVLVLAVVVAALTLMLFAEQNAKKLKLKPVEISETTVFICMTSKGCYHYSGCHHLNLKNVKTHDVCSECEKCEKCAGTTIFISKTDTVNYHHSGCSSIRDYFKGAKKYELCSDCSRLRNKSK